MHADVVFRPENLDYDASVGVERGPNDKFTWLANNNTEEAGIVRMQVHEACAMITAKNFENKMPTLLITKNTESGDSVKPKEGLNVMLMEKVPLSSVLSGECPAFRRPCVVIPISESRVARCLCGQASLSLADRIFLTTTASVHKVAMGEEFAAMSKAGSGMPSLSTAMVEGVKVVLSPPEGKGSVGI